MLMHLTENKPSRRRAGAARVVPNEGLAGLHHQSLKSRFIEGLRPMTRMGNLSHPLLLGFEEIERLIDRAGKGTDGGYPPYNIERIAASAEGQPELLRITLAVAGFTRDQLDITLEDKQLTIRGRQDEGKSREFLHRGIAARQFQRTFVLADGIEVRSADLNNGLLEIDLVKIEPERMLLRIEIVNNDGGSLR